MSDPYFPPYWHGLPPFKVIPVQRLIEERLGTPMPLIEINPDFSNLTRQLTRIADLIELYLVQVHGLIPESSKDRPPESGFIPFDEESVLIAEVLASKPNRKPSTVIGDPEPEEESE